MGPPYDNGAMILRYDVRTTMDEQTPFEEWRSIDKDELANRTRQHGADGRRTLQRDHNALICQVADLASGVPHFFQIRAYNCIGWSEWSEVARFITKPARPGKVGNVTSPTVGTRDLQIFWEKPDTNSLEVDRYDMVGGSNLQLLRWVQIAAMILNTTVDAARLFGNGLADDIKMDRAVGIGALAGLRSEETMYSPISGSARSFAVDGLLPGQDYYFMVRTLTAAGKGEFSNILGPLSTKPEKPGALTQLEMTSVSELSGSLILRLPYAMGSPIIDAHVTLTRCEGPLSQSELHPETGECRDDIAGQEEDLVFHGADRVSPIVTPLTLDEVSGRWLPGTTEALCRSYEHEGLDKVALRRDGHQHTLASVTGRAYSITFGRLRPSTKYVVRWSCRNSLGDSNDCEPTLFTTDSTRPDTPAMLTFTGL